MNPKISLKIRAPLFLALLGLSLATSQAQTELITNGGFESGSTGWTLSGGASVDSAGGFSHSGSFYLWLGGLEDEIDLGYQTITIPGTASSATLSFYYNISSQEGDPVAYDTFSATIRNTSGGVLATVGNWSNIDQDSPGVYHQKTFNLLPYAGQTVRLHFSSTNDSSLYTNFRVDDVSVLAQIGPPMPPTNDVCSGAIAMTADTAYSVSLANATSTGDPTPGCQSLFGKGVWYTFTPGASTTVRISTCGSDFNTVVQVYSGSCGSLTAVACNDDNGPGCSGNRASVIFTATAGTTYRILAGGYNGASGTLSIVASLTTGLTIIPVFDSSITSDPQAALIEATINAAIAVYHSNFSDPVTVSITFQKVNSGLGSSGSYYGPFSYSSYRAALVSHATTADDTLALAHLPNTANNPVNGNQDIDLTLPLARALGFSADPPPGESDGTVYLKTADMNLSPAETNPSKYSLFAVASHEIDEVLGFSSALNSLNNGDPAPTGAVAPEDLFRYDQLGARSLTTALSASSYFSLDGVTFLARFNQSQTGDFGDWYSTGAHTPQVQDAFLGAGSNPVLGVEFRVMDVIGYSRVITISPQPLSYVRQASNLVLYWPTNNPGFSLESSLSLGPSAVWSTVPSAVFGINNVATNSLSGPKKFYRLKR